MVDDFSSTSKGVDRGPVPGFAQVFRAASCIVMWVMAILGMFFAYIFDVRDYNGDSEIPDPIDSDMIAAVQVLAVFSSIFATIATLIYRKVKMVWVPYCILLGIGIFKLVSLASVH
ncbi:hypothetical protein [Sphaerimonospora thailandensis]|uniref:Uncharacterized protein n=1 Tax=Sphaerimonospora thailandensis TaxID=795644 RepID=A0A8J3RBA0_9ACTN|nr:hypothetical protein [Sphaerimonospora thailandensis]GIH70707.1 hypothetical protein Mth01_29600 [Sphaerimonospora thailandensis]